MKLDKKVTFLNDMLMKRLEVQNEEFKNVEDVPDFTKSLIIRMIEMLIRRNVQVNHIAVLFKDENHSYVMDACNDTLFFSDDRNRLYQNNNEFFCKYDIFSNGGQKEKLSKIMLPTDLERIEVLLKDYYEIWNMCFECTDIFEQFYLEHKDLYKDVIDKKKILIHEIKKNRRS